MYKSKSMASNHIATVSNKTKRKRQNHADINVSIIHAETVGHGDLHNNAAIAPHDPVSTHLLQVSCKKRLNIVVIGFQPYTYIQEFL